MAKKEKANNKEVKKVFISVAPDLHALLKREAANKEVSLTSYVAELLK